MNMVDPFLAIQILLWWKYFQCMKRRLVRIMAEIVWAYQNWVFPADLGVVSVFFGSVSFFAVDCFFLRKTFLQSLHRLVKRRMRKCHRVLLHLCSSFCSVEHDYLGLHFHICHKFLFFLDSINNHKLGRSNLNSKKKLSWMLLEHLELDFCLDEALRQADIMRFLSKYLSVSLF